MCDLKSLLEKIYQKGSAMVGLEETKTFLNAVRNITGSVVTVDDGDLMNHYRMFVANLETFRNYLSNPTKNLSFNIRQ